ncbi:MAG: OmpA family protein [Bacteroidota bacterium]
MKKKYFLIVFTLQFSLVCFSQDSLHRYTDPEIIKLTNHIKGLETRTAAYSAAHPNDVFVTNVANSEQERQILYNIVSDSLHRYNDRQIIKLAGYIKHLERLDSLNNIMLAKTDAQKRYNDSVASIVVLAAIDQYEKQIFFNFDSSILTADSYSPLDEAVKILKDQNSLTFVIEGHTDNVGSDEYNLNLSKARAKTVMDYFVSKGIPVSRISSVGYGEAKPIASNETEEGKAKNRRVEIRARKK